MATKSDKPARTTLGLKGDPEAKEAEAETGTERKGRAPLRWSPRQRDRSKEAPPPAKPAGARAKRRPQQDKARVPRDRPGAASEKPRTAPRQPGAELAGERADARRGPQRRAPGGDGAPGPDRRGKRDPVRASGEGRGPQRLARERGVAFSFFAPCPRGLEEVLVRELSALGAVDPTPGSGGVGFAGDMRLAWKVSLWSRLAIRVLWRVGQGRYGDEDDLYAAALALPWPAWFAADQTIAVRTVAHACPLKSLNFAGLRIKDAVCDRFRQENLERPNVDPHNPSVPLLLYLERDQYSLYLDLSGEPLNRRGYRVEAAAAPLNENLAAGLLMLAGWTPDTPLLDPMMGGGTILIEAALLALNIAPGSRRRFAFEHLANFDRVEWARLRKDAQAAALEAHRLPIYGCDLDPRMLRAAGRNLHAAGVEACVALDVGDVLAIHAPESVGLIVTNPPYGVRLRAQGGAPDAPGQGVAPDEIDRARFAQFYGELGDALKQRFVGWTAYLLSADGELPKRIGLRASRRVPLYNGPLECRLYEYRLLAGSVRERAAEG